MKHFARLRSEDEFRDVYRHATVIKHTSIFVLFYLMKNDYRCAFVAGKKVGKAVERNRAKRLLRAHFIEVADRLQPGWYIFVAKKEIISTPYKKRNAFFQKTLQKCSLLQPHHPSCSSNLTSERFTFGTT